MKPVEYSKTEVYVIAYDKGIRQSLKSVLFTKGFRDIKIDDSLDLLVNAINRNKMPSLIILDVDVPEQDACDLISSIRRKGLGEDPYIPVMGMAWNLEKELITKVVNAGFDVFVAKPFSTAQISDNIERLALKRRPFVVTSDYTGPDRHNDPTRENKIPNFNVPNALKSIAVDGLKKADHWRSVATMNDKISQQRLHQLASDINMIVEMIVPDLESKQVDADTVKNLDRLLELLKSTRFYIVKKEQADISDLCVPFYSTVKSLLSATDDINAGDIRKLKPMSDAITAGLCKAEVENEDRSQK